MTDSLQAEIARGQELLAAAEDYRALGVFARLWDSDALAIEGAAMAARNLGLYENAFAILDEGLRAFPGNAKLLYLRALLNLGMQNFAAGWPDYELRLKVWQPCNRPRRWTYPRWRGEALAGGKILVYGEQGYGDEIMFASLIHDLIYAAGASVTLECSHELLVLFTRSFPLVKVLGHELNGSMPEALAGRRFDYECPIGSLAQYLRPTRESFEPARSFLWGYLERSDTLRRAWQRAYDPQRVIGLAWRGGTVYTRREARSLALDAFLPYAEAHRETLFVLLQHDATPEELDRAGRIFNKVISDMPGDLDRAATMIGACDRVISACGTVVHLAGAMGKPVDVLAPLAPEWRYGYTQDFMPWYANVRVHRQARPGDWSRPLERAFTRALV